MQVAAQVLKLVRKINVGRMFDTAREISQQTGKNRLAVFVIDHYLAAFVETRL